MEQAIEKILETWKQSMEELECENVKETIEQARETLAKCPPCIKEALIALASNWSVDDMIQIEPVMNYIKILVEKVITEPGEQMFKKWRKAAVYNALANLEPFSSSDTRVKRVCELLRRVVENE